MRVFTGFPPGLHRGRRRSPSPLFPRSTSTPSISLSLALSLANAAVMQVNLKPPSVARYQFDVRWPIPITSLLIKPALHFLALVALAISRADTIGSLLQLS